MFQVNVKTSIPPCNHVRVSLSLFPLLSSKFAQLNQHSFLDLSRGPSDLEQLEKKNLRHTNTAGSQLIFIKHESDIDVHKHREHVSDAWRKSSLLVEIYDKANCCWDSAASRGIERIRFTEREGEERRSDRESSHLKRSGTILLPDNWLVLHIFAFEK